MANFRYKNILFDWDGSIAHSLPIWLDAYRELFEERKVSIKDADIVYHIFQSPERAARFGVTDLEEFYENLVKKGYAKIPYSPLHNDVQTTIEALNEKGLKLAVVTSTVSEIIHKALSEHNLHKYFGAVISGSDVTNRKPDPEPLLKAMEKLGAKKEETLIIGDSYVDVEAGKSAGITTVIHYPKENEYFYTREAVERLKPDYIINSFRQLLDIIVIK